MHACAYDEGDTLKLPNLRAISGDLTYDCATGFFTTHVSGVYLLHWSVLVRSHSECDSAVILALESPEGDLRHALSGNTSSTRYEPVLVAGSTVVSLCAGQRLALRNRTGCPISLTTAAGSEDNHFIGSLSFYRIG